MGDQDNGNTLNAMGAFIGDIGGQRPGRKLRVHHHRGVYLVVGFGSLHATPPPAPKLPDGLTPSEPEFVIELTRGEIVSLERVSDPMLIRHGNGDHLIALLRETARAIVDRPPGSSPMKCDAIDLASRCLACADSLEVSDQ